MTKHDESPWGPQDDRVVRAALMSLMDDVSAHPLPEPESVRSRAEGRGGDLIDLDLQRRRRRSFTRLAGAAAALAIASGAGLYVANQSPDRPIASSTTDASTSAAASDRSAGATRLTMLEAADWQAVLGRSIERTTAAPPALPSCFHPSADALWTASTARDTSGDPVAGQWIGRPEDDSAPLQETTATALQCPDHEVTERAAGALDGTARFRAWQAVATDGEVRWWLEVTDGRSLSFVDFPQADGQTWTETDLRTIARAVLGEIELEPTPTTSTEATSSPATTSESATTGSTDPATSDSTSDPTASSPSSPSTEPTLPVDGTVGPEYFVPVEAWSSSALTGGAPTTTGPLDLEGSPPYIQACVTGESQAVSALGVRSGPGDDNYFGRQYVMRLSQSEAERAHQELLTGYGNGSCPGPAIGGTATALSPNVFKISQGDFTYYVAIARLSSGGVTALHLAEAKTAPEPLTDSVALSELTRLANAAAQR